MEQSPPAGRVNFFITKDLKQAGDCVWWLKKNGVRSAVILTKHAVQVHPNELEKAKELCKDQV